MLPLGDYTPCRWRSHSQINAVALTVTTGTVLSLLHSPSQIPLMLSYPLSWSWWHDPKLRF